MFKTGQLYDQATLVASLPKQVAHCCDVSDDAARALLSPFAINLDTVTADMVAVIGIETFGETKEEAVLFSVWTLQYSSKRNTYCIRFWKTR